MYLYGLKSFNLPEAAPMPIATTATVKAQIDVELKAQAESTLKALGLDMTSAMRLFLSQVVIQGGIPFEIRLPNPNRETLNAISDSYSGRLSKAESIDALFESAHG
jgi:DNA-damage-inducible protein J